MYLFDSIIFKKLSFTVSNNNNVWSAITDISSTAESTSDSAQLENLSLSQESDSSVGLTAKSDDALSADFGIPEFGGSQESQFFSGNGKFYIYNMIMNSHPSKIRIQFLFCLGIKISFILWCRKCTKHIVYNKVAK